MQITKIGLEALKIDGNIKSHDNLQFLKENINSLGLSRNSTLTLDIIDSMSMPSSVIGFLVKTALQDGIRIVIKAKDHRLKDLLIELELDKVFHII